MTEDEVKKWLKDDDRISAERQEKADLRRKRRAEKRLRDVANGGWWRPRK